MRDLTEVAIKLGVAALGGLAVGVEREWSARQLKKKPQFAGMRTFLFLGLLGGLSAQFIQSGLTIPGLILISAACLIIVMSYAASSLHGDPDSTTEVAALLVISEGVLAGSGHLAVASAISALTALILVEKTRLHGFVERIRSEEIEAGTRFAVLALVILPLLPQGPYGPAPGFRPRELWAMVLIFSGLSFAGFIARRIAGAEKGYRTAGLLGGLISSTAVTLTFSRESRENQTDAPSLAYGVIAACTILFLRVVILTAALNQQLAMASLKYLSVPFFTGILFLFVTGRWTHSEQKTEAPPVKNPLRLIPALQMALAFQLGLYVMSYITARFGSRAFLTTASLLGLTDVDLLTFMLVKLGGRSVTVELAARALAAGVLANTLLKLVLALGIGKGKFLRFAGAGLTLLALTTLTALLFF